MSKDDDSRKQAVAPQTMPSKIGRLADRHVAFWHISSLLTAHPRYRNASFANMRRVQQSVALGNYCCLGDGKAPLQAVATWHGINVAALLRTYPRYAADRSDPVDGIFITSLAAIDRDSLKIMIRHLRTLFVGQDVYWDRHKGKLGHRSKKLRA
jgi:hypothetical protein